MEENNRVKLRLRNAEGKRALELNRLEYAKELIHELELDPSILPEILDTLELKEDDFFSKLSGTSSANITMYDQALSLAKSKNRKTR